MRLIALKSNKSSKLRSNLARIEPLIVSEVSKVTVPNDLTLFGDARSHEQLNSLDSRNHFDHIVRLSKKVRPDRLLMVTFFFVHFPTARRPCSLSIVSGRLYFPFSYKSACCLSFAGSDFCPEHTFQMAAFVCVCTSLDSLCVSKLSCFH